MNPILQMRTLRPKEVNELSQPCHEHEFHVNGRIKLAECPQKTLQQEDFLGLRAPLPSEASKSDRKVVRPMGRGSGVRPGSGNFLILSVGSVHLINP